MTHLCRTVQRLIAQANSVAVELQGVLHIQAVRGVGQLHAIGRQILRAYFDDRQAAFAQAQTDRLGVEAHAFEHDLVIVRNQGLPVFANRGATGLFRCVIQREVDAALIAADEPAPHTIEQPVIRIILVPFAARREAGECLLRMIGVQHPRFAGGFAIEQNDQLAFGTAAEAVQEESTVRLVEHQLCRCIAQCVAMQPAGAMGLVQLTEKQGLAVVGPGHASVAVLKRQAADLAGAQFLDVKLVHLVATGVQAVGQALMVGADAERAQRKEAAIGHGVRVQQQFFTAFVHGIGVVGRARAAIVTGVFIALCGARVIKVRPPRGGQ